MQTLKFDDSQKVFVTSDTHFGHSNIIKYCLRIPLNEKQKQEIQNGTAFDVTQEQLRIHDDTLVNNINLVCGPDDILLHGGDVAWGFENLQEFRERLTCKRIYVTVGNHDDESHLKKLFGWNRVAERYMISIGKNKAVLDHYPGDAWQDSHHACWQLFGHVHGISNERRKLDPKWALSIDVGVDSHLYTPWDWHKQLTPLMNQRYEQWQTWKQSFGVKDRGGMVAKGRP